MRENNVVGTEVFPHVAKDNMLHHLAQNTQKGNFYCLFVHCHDKGCRLGGVCLWCMIAGKYAVLWGYLFSSFL